MKSSSGRVESGKTSERQLHGHMFEIIPVEAENDFEY